MGRRKRLLRAAVLGVVLREFEITLRPGTHEAICTVPGHREAGMVASVEVSP